MVQLSSLVGCMKNLTTEWKNLRDVDGCFLDMALSFAFYNSGDRSGKPQG